MKFIKTHTFSEALKSLKKRYPKVDTDIDFFESHFFIEQGVHLRDGLYKFRLKNSSIPTGQRGGFRLIILLVEDDTVCLLTIYAKTIRENISLKELHTLVDIFLS